MAKQQMTTSRLTAVAIAEAMMGNKVKDERMKRYAQDHKFTSDVVDKEYESNKRPVQLRDEHNTIIFVEAGKNPKKAAEEFTRQLVDNRMKMYKTSHNVIGAPTS